MENGKKHHILVHRLAYQIFNNVDLKSSDIICHKCDNAKCFNPKHLFLGSHQDNVRDRDSKNRQAKKSKNGRYIDGYKSKYEHKEKPKTPFNKLYGRKFTIDEVIFIKKSIKNKKFKTLRELSNFMNVPECSIRDINCGRTYKKIQV